MAFDHVVVLWRNKTSRISKRKQLNKMRTTRKNSRFLLGFRGGLLNLGIVGRSELLFGLAWF